MNFCTKCGNLLKPETRFCSRCGENINPVQQNTNVSGSSIEAFNEVLPLPEMQEQEFWMKNSQRRIVNLWYILAAVFIFCIFLPSIIGLDGFDGGFALSFTAGFMVIMSIVVIIIYHSRAKQLDNILSGEGRMAVWRYSTDEWTQFIAADFEDEKRSKKTLFFIVAVISLVVGIILMIILEDPLVLLIASGIIPIVAIPAFLAPRYRFNKLKNSEPKVLIAEKGVIVGKMFHLWVKLGTRLDQVILNTEKIPILIEFTYSIPTRNGRQKQVARVPVPQRKIKEAYRIVEYFQALGQYKSKS